MSGLQMAALGFLADSRHGFAVGCENFVQEQLGMVLRLTPEETTTLWDAWAEYRVANAVAQVALGAPDPSQLDPFADKLVDVILARNPSR